MNHRNKRNNKFDGNIISSEYFKNDRPSYICSLCQRTLSRLSDAGNNNSTYWCRFCNVEFNPESENLRKESRIITPEGSNSEGDIVSIGITPDVSIKKEPEIKGTFKQLQEKGLKITNYTEHIPE